jgi:hypothetical protein
VATGDYRLRIPSGTIDGVNVSFTTPENYQAGTLVFWLNGQLQDSVYVTETGVNTFDLEFPPIIDDTLYVRYVEA